jgi:hypothetical protein
MTPSTGKHRVDDFLFALLLLTSIFAAVWNYLEGESEKTALAAAASLTAVRSGQNARCVTSLPSCED